jgi:hypothetical protein
MTVRDLLSDDIISLTGETGLDHDVKKGYTCDLLSWVMARGQAGTAWITVQNSMNVVAVATMMDFACIIISEDITIEKSILDKAILEEIPVLGSKLTSYDLSIKLSALGVDV